MTAQRCTTGGKEYIAYHELNKPLGLIQFVNTFFVELGHRSFIGARDGYGAWVSQILGALVQLRAEDKVKWVAAKDGGVDLEIELSKY